MDKVTELVRGQHIRSALMKGGQEGKKYGGPSCFEEPVERPRSFKIFL